MTMTISKKYLRNQIKKRKLDIKRLKEGMANRIKHTFGDDRNERDIKDIADMEKELSKLKEELLVVNKINIKGVKYDSNTKSCAGRCKDRLTDKR